MYLASLISYNLAANKARNLPLLPRWCHISRSYWTIKTRNKNYLTKRFLFCCNQKKISPLSNEDDRYQGPEMSEIRITFSEKSMKIAEFAYIKFITIQNGGMRGY